MQPNPYSAPSAAIDGPTGSEFAEAAVTARVIEMLTRTRPWVRFISVLCFIGTGIMLLIALFMVLGGGAMVFASGMGAAEAGIGIGIAVVYALLAALYIYPALKLWKYANHINLLASSRRTLDLESALNEQRAFWKFCGIAAIVVIGIYLLIIPFALIAGAAASSI